MQTRKNIRLNEYDYSQAGYYFVTICTKDRLRILGEIVGADDPVCPKAEMRLSEIGNIVEKCWYKINDIYEGVQTDIFCIMPNHIHGIIVISTGGQGRPPLHKIIQGFKSFTTRMCFNHNMKTIWQRNYYERVIRNDQEYQKICEYIETNPLKWADDEYFEQNHDNA